MPALKNLSDTHQYYHTVKDFINMPKKSLYLNIEGYYSVLFHEMIHATGHQNRLDRETLTKELSHATSPMEVYSEEELVAELGSAMLSSMAGITSESLKISNASYLKGYLQHLKNDCKFIFKSSSFAQKAVKYILRGEK
jgi:antirestriction protein ArdC